MVTKFLNISRIVMSLNERFLAGVFHCTAPVIQSSVFCSIHPSRQTRELQSIDISVITAELLLLLIIPMTESVVQDLSEK